MEEIMRQITMYHRISLVCFGGMLLCAVAAGVIYKKLNISEVLKSCRRIRKQRKTLALLLMCSVLFIGNNIPSRAEETDLMVEVLPGSDLPEDAFTTEDELVYYVKNLKDASDLKIHVQIRMKEGTWDEEKVRIEYRSVSQETWDKVPDTDVLWEESEEQLFEAVYPFDGMEGEENIYEFRVSYLDEQEEMTYEVSKKFVIDHTTPVFTATYLNENGELLESEEDGISLKPYYNAAKEIHFSMTIEEEYLDFEKSAVKIVGYDGNEQVLSECTPEISEGKAEALIQSDGHFWVQANLTDKSGNSVTHEKKFALDYTPPKTPQITYEADNMGLLARMIHQLTFGYFAKERTRAYILVEDTVSGVKSVSYSYEDVDQKEPVTETVETTEGTVNMELPFSFKGSLKVWAEDRLGNISEVFQDIGVIAESEATHNETSKAAVTVLTQAAKTKDYYNKDVEIRFSAQDTYSGIGTITYLAGSDLREEISYGQDSEIVTEDIVKEYRILSANNNQNDVPVEFTVTDNAGHQMVLAEEALPKIHIDTTAPKVEVQYDNYDVKNEKYYQEERTATVFVTERNFDPKDVQFELSGPTAEIGGWSHSAGEGCQGSEDPYHTGHTDTCVWECDVAFREDGEYSFGFSCTDLAGNSGSYGKTDEFVIDQTAPKIIIDYENHQVQNEFYYAAPRKAAITIVEKNFQAEDVVLNQLTTMKGEVISNPPISGWASEGEYHQAMITYDYDGEFLFDIAYTDLAGNEAAEYVGDYFVIDMTKPEIIISEVLDQSANKDEAAPLITATDVNYVSGSIWCELKGSQNGVVMLEKERGTIAEGETMKLQDIAYEQSSDDMYLLTAGASDLAGNTSNVQIRFSVNRYGSVYELDQGTEKLAGKNGTYYTSVEQPIVITETNVDELVFKEIVCSLNGKLRVLQENIDYTVHETGDESSWKQYRYELPAENFAKEGHYVLTLYSEDRAKNTSDNQSKGKQIAFAVDKTAPSILVSGIEEEGRYREASKKVLVDAQDNLALKEVKICVNGKNVYQDAGEKIWITILASNQWQRMSVYGIDQAGNETQLDEMTFLITPNLLVQFYRNTSVFYTTMTLLAGAAAMITTFLVYKRKSS